jgi:sodium/bile acid cotransporter 7
MSSEKVAWVKKNFLPLALVTAFLSGLALPGVATALDTPKFGEFKIAQSLLVVYIFLLQGANLKVDDIKDALHAYVPVGVGLVIILFLTPQAAHLVARLPFLAPDLKTGITLFLCVPTTVNSGVALVGTAKGSVPVALFMTVLSNTLGVFTVPIMLKVMLATTVDIDLDPIPMLLKLILTILVPALAGMVLKKESHVAAFLKKQKEPLGLSGHVALAMIPFMKVGSSRDFIVALDAGSLIGVVATAICLHVFFLCAINAATKPFPKSFPLEMRKAVVILGSQKTLPVSMAVLASLPEELGEKGTIAVPCILGHLSQLLIDSYVATKWSEIEELKETEEAKEPEVDPEAPKSDDAPSTASTASNVEATAQGERIQV